MKKIASRILLLLAVVMGSAFFGAFNAEASTGPKRNYNCRMPQRHQNHHESRGCHQYESQHLFCNLGLSARQCERLDKSYVKYQRDMDKILRRVPDNPRRAEQYRRDAVRRENSFLNEVRYSLNPSQYRVFETRFVSMVPYIPADSAPRPGSGIGPMMPGPAPTIMTNGRR